MQRTRTDAYAFGEPVCPRGASAQKIRAGIVIPDCRGSPGVGGETGRSERDERRRGFGLPAGPRHYSGTALLRRHRRRDTSRGSIMPPAK